MVFLTQVNIVEDPQRKPSPADNASSTKNLKKIPSENTSQRNNERKQKMQSFEVAIEQNTQSAPSLPSVSSFKNKVTVLSPKAAQQSATFDVVGSFANALNGTFHSTVAPSAFLPSVAEASESSNSRIDVHNRRAIVINLPQIKVPKIVERNLQVVRNWKRLNSPEARQKRNRERSRHQQTVLQRRDALEADYVSYRSSRLERKMSASERLLLAMTDPVYGARMFGWTVSIEAVIWLLITTSKFEIIMEAVRYEQRKKEAATYLSFKLRRLFRVYKKKKVDRAFPQNSRTRATVLIYLQQRHAAYLDRCANHIRSFLQHAWTAVRFRHILNRFRIQIYVIQNFIRNSLQRGYAKFELIELQFLAAQRKAIADYEAQSIHDLRLVIEAKIEIRASQHEVRNDLNVKELLSAVLPSIRNSSIKTFAVKELGTYKRTPLDMGLYDILRDSQNKTITTEHIRGLIPVIGNSIVFTLRTTGDELRKKMIREALKRHDRQYMELRESWRTTLSYHQRIANFAISKRTSTIISPRDASLAVMLQSQAPKPPARRVLLPAEQLQDLVRRGLESANGSNYSI